MNNFTSNEALGRSFDSQTNLSPGYISYQQGLQGSVNVPKTDSSQFEPNQQPQQFSQDYPHNVSQYRSQPIPQYQVETSIVEPSVSRPQLPIQTVILPQTGSFSNTHHSRISGLSSGSFPTQRFQEYSAQNYPLDSQGLQQRPLSKLQAPEQPFVCESNSNQRDSASWTASTNLASVAANNPLNHPFSSVALPNKNANFSSRWGQNFQMKSEASMVLPETADSNNFGNRASNEESFSFDFYPFTTPKPVTMPEITATSVMERCKRMNETGALSDEECRVLMSQVSLFPTKITLALDGLNTGDRQGVIALLDQPSQPMNPEVWDGIGVVNPFDVNLFPPTPLTNLVETDADSDGESESPGEDDEKMVSCLS